MIKLSYVWPNGITTEMWLSAEDIVSLVATPTGQSLIALSTSTSITVAEHPHDIIRMIVNSREIPADDDEQSDAYAQ